MEDNVLRIYSKFYNQNKGSKDTMSDVAVNLPDNKNTVTPQEFTKDNIVNNNFATDKKLVNDINNVKDTFKSFRKIQTKVDSIDKNLNNEIFAVALSPFPFLRRVKPIENSKNNDNNKIKMAGLGVLGIVNLKEDLRDLLTIFNRAESNVEKGFYSIFKFFAGTLIEKPLRKTEWGEYILNNLDKTVGETKLAKKLYKKIGIKFEVQPFEKEINFFLLKKETVERDYVKFLEIPDKKISRLRLNAGKLIGTTLHKMPLISIGFASMLELPQLIKAVKNNNLKQIPKSANSVVSISLCGAFMSTLLSMAIGSAGGVMGLGLGMYLGSQFAKYKNSKY
ncbi:MAG: hypothetical protein PHC34_03395 [Candidatus Gastranaerophilales bacterium]|nr:hypothetical protein [Candidatus Gastranaerophilales bacterium]